MQYLTDMSNMFTELKSQLDALCIFRTLLADKVISSLYRCLEDPSVWNYSDFVSMLYEANGGFLGEYIKELCENSCNVYVRLVGSKKGIPEHMEKALQNELTLLQKLSDLKSAEFCKALNFDGALSEFQSGGVDLCRSYAHRMANIHKFGYGIYAKNEMFFLDENGTLVPAANPDSTRLSDLIDYERERKIIIDNTRALLAGKPAANILLTGDAGTGKSSTVKAVGNELFSEGLRIIEVRKDQLSFIPSLLNTLSDNPLKFVLFIDDLSFLKDDDNFNALKAVLEGSVSAKSPNVVIYATSNRRHIIKENFSDRDGDEVHRNDTMQELVSLSERFGIHVTFSKPTKAIYLKIVHHLADECGIEMDGSELDLLAERFALERGNRSARLAKQFIDGLLSK